MAKKRVKQKLGKKALRKQKSKQREEMRKELFRTRIIETSEDIEKRLDAIEKVNEERTGANKPPITPAEINQNYSYDVVNRWFEELYEIADPKVDEMASALDDWMKDLVNQYGYDYMANWIDNADQHGLKLSKNIMYKVNATLTYMYTFEGYKPINDERLNKQIYEDDLIEEYNNNVIFDTEIGMFYNQTTGEYFE